MFVSRSILRVGAAVLSIGLICLVLGTVGVEEVASAPPLPAQVDTVSAPLDDFIDRKQLDNYADFPGGSQLTFLRLSDGKHVGSATERFPRPALSLIKLYIADYVLLEGEEDDRQIVVKMIETSDDLAAELLTAKYPDAISQTVSRYELRSTQAGRPGERASPPHMMQ